MPEELKTEHILKAIRAGARIVDARYIFAEHIDNIGGFDVLPNVLYCLNKSYVEEFMYENGQREARKRPIPSSDILNQLQIVRDLKKRRAEGCTNVTTENCDASPFAYCIIS